MTLSLDGARERVVGSNQAIVQCVSAMWTYRYHNGYIVTLRGPFTAYVSVIPNATQNGAPAQSVPPSGFTLKIDHIQFDSNVYEKHVAVDVIGGNRLDSNKTPQVRNGPTPSPTMNGAAGPPPPLPPPHPPQPPPSQAGQRDEGGWEDHRITYERAYIPTEPVNAFGIPQATMRCLEVRTPNVDLCSGLTIFVTFPAGGKCRTNDRSYALFPCQMCWSFRCVFFIGETSDVRIYELSARHTKTVRATHSGDATACARSVPA